MSQSYHSNLICQSSSKAVVQSEGRGGFNGCPDRTTSDLLYLNSNNTTEKLNLLSPYHQKQALVQIENASRFINKIGIERVGFLTLTFADNVEDHKEAYRRFCSMRNHFLSKHFGAWVMVKERQKRGAWHYHLLVDCFFDIRTGIDWNEIRNGKYSSASLGLRNYWDLLRENLPKYNFGRSELLPIESNVEGMSKYVGKYISKHLDVRREEDKGVRLFSASKGQILSSTKFSWNTKGGKLWRSQLKAFCNYYGFKSTDKLKDQFGSHWAYFLADDIINFGGNNDV